MYSFSISFQQFKLKSEIIKPKVKDHISYVWSLREKKLRVQCQ